jgi:hypothetical protein
LIGTAVFVGITFGVLHTRLASLTSGHKLLAIGLLALLALPGAAVYMWVTKLLKMPESAYLDKALSRLSGKRELRAELDAQSEIEIDEH